MVSTRHPLTIPGNGQCRAPTADNSREWSAQGTGFGNLGFGILGLGPGLGNLKLGISWLGFRTGNLGFCGFVVRVGVWKFTV